jgi:hypothetical protein
MGEYGWVVVGLAFLLAIGLASPVLFDGRYPEYDDDPW